MRELADLDALSGLKRLTHLILLENPVVGKEVSLQLRRALEMRDATGEGLNERSC